MTAKTAPWKLHHVADELRESYMQCQTENERINWRVFARKDVNRILNGRKPTPGEESILAQYGLP